MHALTPYKSVAPGGFNLSDPEQPSAYCLKLPTDKDSLLSLEDAVTLFTSKAVPGRIDWVSLLSLGVAPSLFLGLLGAARVEAARAEPLTPHVKQAKPQSQRILQQVRIRLKRNIGLRLRTKKVAPNNALGGSTWMCPGQVSFWVGVTHLGRGRKPRTLNHLELALIRAPSSPAQGICRDVTYYASLSHSFLTSRGELMPCTVVRSKQM